MTIQEIKECKELQEKIISDALRFIESQTGMQIDKIKYGYSIEEDKNIFRCTLKIGDL